MMDIFLLLECLRPYRLSPPVGTLRYTNRCSRRFEALPAVPAGWHLALGLEGAGEFEALPAVPAGWHFLLMCEVMQSV